MFFPFRQDQFIATVEVIIKKRSAITLTVDEEWMTEKEMKEYGWSPNLFFVRLYYVFFGICLLAWN